jgi:glucan 1,3-beta-glucosidase
VKDVSGHPVAGDGSTDDTASLQAIINQAAGNSVLYFPHGIYILTDTLFIPAGSRLVGEAWTQLAASGSKFANAKSPKSMIQVGKAGDVGLAQFTDFLFTVADVLPGTIMVEVNMAGDKPGNVGFFNCHFRIGGAKGTKVESCKGPSTCNAAHLCAHLTTTSSVYWENSWAWSADHDVDGGSSGQPSDAGGFFIESQNATWLLGIGLGKSASASYTLAYGILITLTSRIEHHALYQMNIYKAKNVFIGLQQGESAYWQVNAGNSLINPAPWTDSLLPGEPDFSWCGASDTAVSTDFVFRGCYNNHDMLSSSTNFCHCSAVLACIRGSYNLVILTSIAAASGTSLAHLPLVRLTPSFMIATPSCSVMVLVSSTPRTSSWRVELGAIKTMQ